MGRDACLYRVTEAVFDIVASPLEFAVMLGSPNPGATHAAAGRGLWTLCWRECRERGVSRSSCRTWRRAQSAGHVGCVDLGSDSAFCLELEGAWILDTCHDETTHT